MADVMPGLKWEYLPMPLRGPDSGDVWRQRGEDAVRAICRALAVRLEEVAALDDLALLRRAKQLDSDVAKMQQLMGQFSPVQWPQRTAHYRDTLTIVRDQTADERRQMLREVAGSLRQFADGPFDAEALQSIAAKLGAIPSSLQ